jgi:phenylacetate-CoA ligase
MGGPELSATLVDRPQGGWRAAKYWDEGWQRMSRQQLDEIHLRRIRQLIAYAYDRVPFYRRLYDDAGVHPDDVRTLQDFHERVPFVDKPDVMADQARQSSGLGLESVPPERRAWFHRTSGTTGVPLNEVFTSYDRLIAAYEAWAYGWWDMGLRPGNSMYFAFNFGTFIGFWSALFAAERLGLMVIPGGGLDTRGRLRQIGELRPDAVIGTPTYLLHMGDTARAEDIDLPAAGVRFLSTAGEIGANVPTFRRALREAWGNPRVCDIYGISEPIFAACECSAVDDGRANGLHVVERYIHSYVIDPATSLPVEDESQVGEHIVTSFRLGQPLIKYRTHDLVRLERSPDHGCGWGFAFLDGGVLARTDGMVTIRGVNIYTTAVQNIIGSVAGASPHYELHITRDGGQDAMEVRLEALPGATDHDALGKRLSEELRYQLGVTLAVDVGAPESLPRYELKSKRIFDHRKEVGP